MMRALNLKAVAALVVSVWSFAVVPVMPACAAFLSSGASPSTAAASATSSGGAAASSSDTDSDTARTLAGYAQSAGSMLDSSRGGMDMGTVAGDQLRSAASGAATSEVQRWLSGFGTARVRLDVDRHFTLKNSEFDLLLPWYDTPEWVVFSQQSLHRTDDRTQMNLGAGVRHFGAEWMTGANAFYDYDLTRYHQRAGLGAELWRDYLKLGANGYFRLSGWRDAPELNNAYEARPANGWDVRAEGWIPAYPQVGGKLTYEQYYGNEVALFGTGNRQKNPQAVTAGLNWTPVPLLTLSAEHSMGNGGMNIDNRFGLQLTWTPGLSLSQQLDPDAVRERRTLAGSRLDLVERNNNIVLEYRKKELIKLGLLARAEGNQGQAFTLVTSLQTKYPLQGIDWSAGDFLSAGGQISGSGTTTQFILPAYRPGATTAQAQQLNTYTVTAVARDSQGNVSSRAQSVLVVESPGGVQIESGNLTASSGARANGLDTNTVTAIVTNSAGQPVAGETVVFTLQSGVSPAGIARSSTVRVTTNGSGVATLDMVSLVPGTYTIQAQTGTAPAVSTTTTFALNTDTGNPDILNLQLTVPKDAALANGQDQNVVSVVVRDKAGQVQANTAVHFSVAPGTATLSAADVNTDSNGIAQVTLTSTTVARYIVAASTGGGTRTIPVYFQAVRLQGTLTASPQSIVADDSTTSTLTLTVTDQSGTPQPGKTVVFNSSLNGVTFGGITDSNGTYTTTMKGTQPGPATITATVGGNALSNNPQTSVTLTAQQPVYTMTANTQVNPYTFAANSGFPTTGFVNATFTTVLPSGSGVPSDYTWTVQKQGGGSVSWLSVDGSGMVTFNNRPSSADKSVEIIATPKAGGQPLGYRFTLDGWFIYGSPSGSDWYDAEAWCISQGSGYVLPTLQQLSGNATVSDSTRGVIGGLWSEWGNLAGRYHYGWPSADIWTTDVAPAPDAVYTLDAAYGNLFIFNKSKPGGTTGCRQGL